MTGSVKNPTQSCILQILNIYNLPNQIYAQAKFQPNTYANNFWSYSLTKQQQQKKIDLYSKHWENKIQKWM